MVIQFIGLLAIAGGLAMRHRLHRWTEDAGYSIADESRQRARTRQMAAAAEAEAAEVRKCTAAEAVTEEAVHVPVLTPEMLP